MEINITPEIRQIWQEILDQLSGQARGDCSWLRGSQVWAAVVPLGPSANWDAIEPPWAKACHELESGVICLDNVRMRGRKGFAPKLPQLEDDLRAIGEASSQTDPTFRTTQLDYAKEIGFKGQFYIEPKPMEPTKHQYDSDTAACLNFLQDHHLMGRDRGRTFKFKSPDFGGISVNVNREDYER